MPFYTYFLYKLDRVDETDAEVNWEDQCKINTFSKLNQRLQYRKGYLKEKKVYIF